MRVNPRSIGRSARQAAISQMTRGRKYSGAADLTDLGEWRPMSVGVKVHVIELYSLVWGTHGMLYFLDSL